MLTLRSQKRACSRRLNRRSGRRLNRRRRGRRLNRRVQSADSLIPVWEVTGFAVLFIRRTQHCPGGRAFILWRLDRAKGRSGGRRNRAHRLLKRRLAGPQTFAFLHIVRTVMQFIGLSMVMTLAGAGLAVRLCALRS